jgi:uncharacterized protein YbjQ (UPF0145 family)
MLLTTTETVPGKQVKKILGIARGNTIRARGVGGHIVAGLRMLEGGEIKEYVTAMNDAREQALERMVGDAKKMKADAVINIRFTTSDIMQGAAEILVYGTAVTLK